MKNWYVLIVILSSTICAEICGQSMRVQHALSFDASLEIQSDFKYPSLEVGQREPISETFSLPTIRVSYSPIAYDVSSGIRIVPSVSTGYTSAKKTISLSDSEGVQKIFDISVDYKVKSLFVEGSLVSSFQIRKTILEFGPFYRLIVTSSLKKNRKSISYATRTSDPFWPIFVPDEPSILESSSEFEFDQNLFGLYFSIGKKVGQKNSININARYYLGEDDALEYAQPSFGIGLKASHIF